MMDEHRYIGSAETDDVELVRLRLMEDVFDPTTTRHLETVGVAEGWKCLEVGAGAGIFTRQPHIRPAWRDGTTNVHFAQPWHRSRSVA